MSGSIGYNCFKHAVASGPVTVNRLMAWSLFYTLIRQRDLGVTTHNIQNISNISKMILDMFYLSPDDIKNYMKLFFAYHFLLLPV